MTPDQKYMNRDIKKDIENSDIEFAPFSTSLVGWLPISLNAMNFQNNIIPAFNSFAKPPSTNIKIPNSNNNSSENFPSDNEDDELFSYNNYDKANSNNNTSPAENNTYSNINKSNREEFLPSSCDMIKLLDISYDDFLELERHKEKKKSHCSIEKIYDDIKCNNKEILEVLCSYGIPEPIYKVLVMKIIKLSCNYCKKE